MGRGGGGRQASAGQMRHLLVALRLKLQPAARGGKCKSWQDFVPGLTQNLKSQWWQSAEYDETAEK